MGLVNKILNKLDGLHYPQEYLCMAREAFEQPPRVYIIRQNQVITDITNRHLFTGYNPLVFTLYSYPNKENSLTDEIEVIFSQKTFYPNDFFDKKDAIARLSMKLVKKQTTGEMQLFYYEGVQGAHQFISRFNQSIIGLHNRLNNKKPGNVFLHDNLYRQVQIAYSLPRNISLITVGHSQSYNLFPTDLHGAVGETYYVDSLRHEGKACRQVEAAGKMLISEVDSASYKTVYSLGKNHMREPGPKGNFPFGEQYSPSFNLPLPQSALYYRELELIEAFCHGIHRILLFRIVSQQRVSDKGTTLSHIHNSYATWRDNNGLSGNYLLR